MNPKISIMMPAYIPSDYAIAHTYMDAAVESILRQTFTDFELIIVDDGSEDYLSNYVAWKDSRIIMMRKQNGGTGSALNLGFRLAQGEYGTYLANDNIYHPQMLARLLAALEGHPDCVLAYSDYERIDKEGKLWAVRHRPFFRKMLHTGYQMGICYLFRMEAKRAAGEYSEEICEDYDMAVRLATQGDFVFVPEILGSFRDHFGSLSNMKVDEVRVRTEEIKKMAQEIVTV